MTSICFKRCVPKNLTIFKQVFALKNQPQPIIFSQVTHSFNRNLIFQSKFISNEANKLSIKKDELSEKHEKPEFSESKYGTEKPNVNVGLGTGNAIETDEAKPGIFTRFKQMYRDYWYVLVPVHLVTSVGWFGGFYYMAKR